MDANKINTCLLLLLVCGIVVMEMSRSAEACPQYCLEVEYMTCGDSTTKLNPRCNCCLAPKGCTLHLTDGSSVHCP